MRSFVRLAGVLVLAVAVIAAVMAVTSKRGAAHVTSAAARSTTTQQSAAAAKATPTASPSATPSATTAPATPATTTVTQTMQSILVGAETRQYLVIAPSHQSSTFLPIIVVLHGIEATLQEEIQRDNFTPLVQHGAAELVYPQGLGESWNAGGCCGLAAQDGEDDTTFLEDLIATVDPGHGDPVYLVGYSNGGRMAYTLACDDPSLVDGYAIVKSVPLNPCAAQAPITIVQIASTDDWEVPYQPGDSGDESPPVTQQVALLQQSNGCDPASTTTVTGSLTYVTWTACAQGTRLAFATYASGSHLWPAGDAGTPSAASVIEGFFGVSG